MLTPAASLPLIRIGIMRSTSIGDVVLATACLDLLRQVPAPIEIVWVGRKPALGLLASAFPELKVVEVDPDLSNYADKVAKELSEVHFVIDLQTNLRSKLICRALKKDFQIPSYKAQKRSFERGRMVMMSHLLGRRRSLPKESQEPETLQYEMMVSALKLGLQKHLPLEFYERIAGLKAYPLLATDHDAGDRPWQKELKFGRWIAVAPGAAYATKQAPQSLLKTILELFHSQCLKDPSLAHESIGLLFVGNEKEREIAVSILDQIDWKGPVLNLAGKLNLWETSLALREVEVLVSNDSALLHIAEAVGVPVAALFGPTVEGFGFPPWRSQSRSFSANLGCRPCSKHGKQDCRYGDKLCFGLIQPAQVVEHLRSTVKQGMLNPERKD